MSGPSIGETIQDTVRFTVNSRVLRRCPRNSPVCSDDGCGNVVPKLRSLPCQMWAVWAPPPKNWTARWALSGLLRCTVKVSLISSRSAKQKRKVSSTLAGGTLALGQAVAEAEWMQVTSRDMMVGDVKRQDRSWNVPQQYSAAASRSRVQGCDWFVWFGFLVIASCQQSR